MNWEEIGLSRAIRGDNGSEFISKKFTTWCMQRSIEIRYIQLSKLMKNGFIEWFNRTFREAALDAYWFEDIEKLRIITKKWKYDYNFYNPHKTLDYKSPCQFASRYFKDLILGRRKKMRNLLNLDLSEKW